MFAHAGTSGGATRAGAYYSRIRGRMIFDKLGTADPSAWRIYFHDMPHLWLAGDTWTKTFGGHFHFMGAFAHDVASDQARDVHLHRAAAHHPAVEQPASLGGRQPRREAHRRRLQHARLEPDRLREVAPPHRVRRARRLLRPRDPAGTPGLERAVPRRRVRGRPARRRARRRRGQRETATPSTPSARVSRPSSSPPGSSGAASSAGEARDPGAARDVRSHLDPGDGRRDDRRLGRLEARPGGDEPGRHHQPDQPSRRLPRLARLRPPRLPGERRRRERGRRR